MKTIFFLFMTAFLTSSFISSCERKQETERGPGYLSSDKKAVQLIKADNAFAYELFEKTDSVNTDDNFMISPLSVAIALGMTYNGAENQTKQAFEHTLRLEGMSRHDINKIHGDLITWLVKADPKVTFEIANSIWVNHMFSIMSAFADTNAYYYHAEVAGLDFSDPRSVETINNWVSDNTHGKISSIIEQIPPLAAMYLINAMYFYGTWTYTFDEEKTGDMVFHYEDGTTGNVKAMQINLDVDYFRNETFSSIELPYGDKKFVMDIILPAGGKTVRDVAGWLAENQGNGWLDEFTEARDLLIRLPRFSFEYKITLNDALKSMGLGIAFTDDADFSGMLEEMKNLAISRVLHKTYIDVNEKGTEAAAVTAVEITYTSVQEPSVFFVDRPFLFLIREKDTGAVIFTGKVGRPVF